jgi:hypothetical protein
MTTGHPGFGGVSRCEMEGSKFCEIRQMGAFSGGMLEDGSGISCKDATAADRARCVASIPEPTEDFRDFTNNCHQDVSNRASKCCLSYAECFHAMPTCFLNTATQ